MTEGKHTDSRHVTELHFNLESPRQPRVPASLTFLLSPSPRPTPALAPTPLQEPPQAQRLTYFHLEVLIQEEVAQLEVPVYDSVPVQVLAAQDDLPQVVAGLGLRQRLPALVQLQERLGGRGRGGGAGGC